MSKRDDILNTALELFIANGIEGTPTSLISKEAGVATGTLFHHFKTKEELINALYIHLKEDIVRSVSVDLRNTDTIKKKTMIMLLEFAKWAIANRNKYEYLQMAATSKYIEESTVEQVNELFSESKAVIEEGYRQGVFKIQPPELFESIMHANMYATVSYFIKHPDQFENEDIRNGAFESLWRALSDQ